MKKANLPLWQVGFYLQMSSNHYDDAIENIISVFYLVLVDYSYYID